MKGQFTLEVYKADRRTKTGERLHTKQDFECELSRVEQLAKDLYPARKGYRTEVHLTYIQKVSAYDGRVFTERYDTPYYCSPSSETYWSM